MSTSRIPNSKPRLPDDGMRLFLAFICFCAAGCGTVNPLKSTAPSPELVARAILQALVVRDAAALHRIALTEYEFRDHVWPQLPAARPERNLPFSYVWGDLHQKSEQALARILQQHGGRRYDLQRVEFAGRTDYATYRVHREARLHVRDSSGTAREIRLCGSMVEKEGTWKVFSYVVND